MTDRRRAVAAGVAALMALSVLLRTRALNVGFWIDEGLSVGIADRPLLDIPGVLRLDGSPPLYYMLLDIWMSVFGRSEMAVHGLSLVFAVLCVPIAFWAGDTLFDRRTAWIAALLFAINPFLTQYAQEARMYSLVILCGSLATTFWLLAFTEEHEGVPVRLAVAFGLAFSAMLYAHNWALFFGVATGLAWLGLVWRAPATKRARILKTGLIAYALIVVAYLPWLPTAIYQAGHTGAPWSRVPSFGYLITVPARIYGDGSSLAVLIAGGFGLWTLSRRGVGSKRPVVLALIAIVVGTYLLAWLSSQFSPAWAYRYLAAGVPPLLLLAAVGFGAAGRVGLVGLVITTVLWTLDDPPDRKSNVRPVGRAISRELRPGDLVVSTQPEQVAVIHYYVDQPKLRWATLTGPVKDVGVTDWRDGVERLKRTSAERDLIPLLDAMPSGQRIAIVSPVIYSTARWSAPWTELVRLRSEEWLSTLALDDRFKIVAVQPVQSVAPGVPNPVHARVYEKR